MSQTVDRFVALDVHKHYVVAGAVNAQQEVVLRPRRVPFTRFAGWIARHLRPTDAVVIEATTNAWHVYDLVAPLVAQAVVAHAYRVKLIAALRPWALYLDRTGLSAEGPRASFVKTDKIDTLCPWAKALRPWALYLDRTGLSAEGPRGPGALSLARLLAAHIIPQVWVPPHPVRDLRALIAHRRRLVSHRSAAKNRLHSLLHRHNIVPPRGDLFSATQRPWWDHLSVSAAQKPLVLRPKDEGLRARHDFSIIDHLNLLIEEVERELASLSVSEPWAEMVPFLIQLPGFGLLVTMTVPSTSLRAGSGRHRHHLSLPRRQKARRHLSCTLYLSGTGQVRPSTGLRRPGDARPRLGQDQTRWGHHQAGPP